MRTLLAACLLVTTFTQVSAQDEVDRKTLKRILEEIELVPSLYAKSETPTNVKTAPKFSSLKLVGYPIGKVNAPDVERPKWLKDKSAYAKEHPLRAAVFEAAEESAEAMKLDLPMTLNPDPKTGTLSAKAKADYLKKQEPVGRAIFKLEGVLTQMKEADANRGAEKIRRWTLDFDFALTRLHGNIMFLYEYNFTQGQIRADKLPELRPGDAGWTMAKLPKITVMETKAKAYGKERAILLRKIQEDHAETPWAYYAKRDAEREMGMQWAVRKK